MAAQELRRAVQHEVGAVLERPQVDRRGGGGVHEHGRRVRGGCVEVGEGQERVRRRLEPDQIGAGRRRGGLVELDVDANPQRSRSLISTPTP